MDKAALGCQVTSGLDMVSPQLPRPRVLLALRGLCQAAPLGCTEVVPDARTLFPCLPRAWTCPSETCLSRG